MKKRILVYFYDAHLKRRREALWTEPDPAAASQRFIPDAETFTTLGMTSGFLGPLVEQTPEGPVFVRRVALNEVLYLMVEEG